MSTRIERAKLMRLGIVRPRPKQALRPIHIPARYPVLRLDDAGKGRAYVRVQRELALIESECAWKP